jgi:hypothetical protein
MAGGGTGRGGTFYLDRLGRAGIYVALWGVSAAVLALAGVEDPLWIGVVVAALAAFVVFVLVTAWHLVRALRLLTVVSMVICAALFVVFSIESVAPALAHGPPGAPLCPRLTAALVHSPAPIFLVVTVFLAVSLAVPKKRPVRSPRRPRTGPR